ncbi:hypothetical protein NUSPORA_00222 [Nucleospora cyclopteri]
MILSILYFLHLKTFYLLNEGVKKFIGNNSQNLLAEITFNPVDLTVKNFDLDTLQFILSLEESKGVLDRSGSDGHLINWAYHGASNQKFRIFLAPNDQIMIEQNGYCVFYDEHLKQFDFRPCNGFYNTFFSIYYELRIPNRPNCVSEFLNKTNNIPNNVAESNSPYFEESRMNPTIEVQPDYLSKRVFKKSNIYSDYSRSDDSNSEYSDSRSNESSSSKDC